MSPESTGMSDFERKIGKAFVEASKAASQAGQMAKKIMGEMSEETIEAKGYDLPALDLLETNQELIARLSLPGVSKENINIQATEDSLSVDAQAASLEGKYLRRELPARGFRREIKLPVEIKPEQVKASYINGILEVHLPKLVAINPTSVKVD